MDQRDEYHEAEAKWVLLWTADNLELLNSMPRPRRLAEATLSDIDVALRVDRDALSMHELSYLVTHTDETRQDFAIGAVNYLNLLIVFIGGIHKLLSRIWRKRQRHHGTPPANQMSRVLTFLLEIDVDGPLEAAHFVEHLGPVPGPIADVH